MSWIVLFIAGFFEIGWAVGLKFLAGFEKPLVLFSTALSVFLSMALLSWAMKHIPMGTAYAVWTGIGILGTFFVGVLFFEENFSLLRVASVCFILLGLLGLKFA